jgi:cysteinyl-tRNA synthetase
MRLAAEKLRNPKRKTKAINRYADQKSEVDLEIVNKVKGVFKREMDDGLSVERAFDKLYQFVEDIKPEILKPETASGLAISVRKVDEVLRAIF